MIVPMKKIHLVVQKKDVLSTVENLRDIGVVHVQHQEALTSEQLTILRQETENLIRAAEILRQFEAEFRKEIEPRNLADTQGPGLIDWEEKVSEILSSASQIDHYKESMAKRQLSINEWKAWGDFYPQDIQELALKGIYVQLCEISSSEKLKIPADVVCHVISSSKGMARCVLISREKLNLSFKTVFLPAASLREMFSSQEQEREKIQEEKNNILNNFSYLEILEDILKQREEILKFEEVVAGIREENGLISVKGFAPLNQCQELEIRAKKEHWGLLIEDPSSEDSVPTLIKAPRWVEIIKPVFSLINVLPGYREYDISLIFLIFFSIFFGILIGDAGYGTLFFILTFLAQIKFKDKLKDKTPLFLVYVLSGCAIVWGLLTGTCFGTTLLGQMVKPLVIWLTENKNVQLLCFFIGAFHLSIAHGWRFLIKIPAFSSIAEAGWILVIWGAFFIANFMILGTPLMGFVKYLFMAGFLFIILDILSRPKDNIFVGFILFIFSVISAFTDVVSYVRLFAVGLAGAAVADAFNEMALSVGFNGFLTGLITALILVCGHLFNIVLGGFGILVHGLRLNVLEFSGHLGLEWAGIRYEPFRKKIKEIKV